MKKVFFVLLLYGSILCLSTEVFAQSSYDNRGWISETYKEQFPYPTTLGVYGFYNYSFNTNVNGDYSKLYDGHGGGFSINGKISFFRWLALALDFSYSYTSATSYSNHYVVSSDGMSWTTTSTTESLEKFLFSPMIVFQSETPRGVAGLVPWGAVGFSIANHNSSQSYSNSHTELGVILATGFKYNLKNNMFIGMRMDYQLLSYDSNFLLGLEAGYRF